MVYNVIKIRNQHLGKGAYKIMRRNKQQSAPRSPEYKLRRAIAAAILMPLGAAGLAACGEAPKNTPPATASATPGASESPTTPGASESPTDKVDALHITVEQLKDGDYTDQDLYPLPEELLPGYVAEHRDEIPELFAVTVDTETVTTAEDVMKSVVKQVFDNVNATNRFGDDADTIERNNAGDGTAVKDRQDDYHAAWKASVGKGDTVKPTEGAERTFNHIMFARLYVAMSEKLAGATSDYPTVAINAPDWSTFKATDNGDGTYSATLRGRALFSVDNKAAAQVDGSTFVEYDTMETWSFNKCKIADDGRATCASIENTPDK